MYRLKIRLLDRASCFFDELEHITRNYEDAGIKGIPSAENPAQDKA
jgi:hypothetical protein